MKNIRKISLVFVFILSILLPVNLPVSAVTYPQIESTSPSASDQNVPVDTDIRITFNERINSVSSGNISVMKVDNGYYIPVSIKEYRKNGKELMIIPNQPLEFNKVYRVELSGNSVTLQNGVYNQNLVYTFKTNYIEFYELMVVNERRLSNLLASYSPRQIKAFAPKRYIEEVSVIHKKQGALDDGQASTEGLTNIDIKTKNEDVKHVHIDIMKNGKILKKGFANKIVSTGAGAQKSLQFDLGFSNIPDYYDVRVTAVDGNQNTLDQQIIKFAAEDNKVISKLKETYKYKTAGNGYSFFELLDNESLFTSFLSESPIQSLKVQVEDR